MYQLQTYLKDTGDNDVKGIVVVERDESDGYRVVENRDGKWCKPFWMPESELESHDTEAVGVLSSDQFSRVCKASGFQS